MSPLKDPVEVPPQPIETAPSNGKPEPLHVETQEFKGAVLLITHNRDLLRKVAKELELQDLSCHNYEKLYCFVYIDIDMDVDRI